MKNTVDPDQMALSEAIQCNKKILYLNSAYYLNKLTDLILTIKYQKQIICYTLNNIVTIQCIAI